MTIPPRARTGLLLTAVLALPLPASAQVADTTALNEAAIAWVGLLQREEFDSAVERLDPAAIAAGLTPEAVEQAWRQISAQLGALESLEPGIVTSNGGFDTADLVGAFANATLTVRVVFNSELQVAGFFVVPLEGGNDAPEWTPPTYVDRSAFHEEELTVGDDPWALPATLTLPTGDGPFPAVVLVHGSGPNDRDGTIGPSKVLKDFAWGMASRGIAVLRYDKRTLVHGARMTEVTLAAEVVDDALAAVELVRARAGVDPSRVVVLGHSLGGMMAPEIARRDRRLAGVVLAAAPARPFDVVLREQLEYVSSLGGPNGAATQDMLAGLERWEAGTLGEGETVIGVPGSYMDELSATDPVETVKALDIPILVLQGGRDYQVTMADFGLFRTGLGTDRATFHAYPDLNHLFVEGAGKATPAEYAEPGHVAAQVIDDLARWVRGR